MHTSPSLTLWILSNAKVSRSGGKDNSSESHRQQICSAHSQSTSLCHKQTCVAEQILFMLVKLKALRHRLMSWELKR